MPVTYTLINRLIPQRPKKFRYRTKRVLNGQRKQVFMDDLTGIPEHKYPTAFRSLKNRAVNKNPNYRKRV